MLGSKIWNYTAVILLLYNLAKIKRAIHFRKGISIYFERILGNIFLFNGIWFVSSKGVGIYQEVFTFNQCCIVVWRFGNQWWIVTDISYLLPVAYR